MTNPIAITLIPNGPIKIENVQNAQFCGQPLSTDGAMFVCRCGASQNPPFCDGSHAKVGFDDTCEYTDDAKIATWEGKTLNTKFNGKTCMHVFYCQPLKELRARELDGDKDAATEIIRVVNSCPSGALSYELKDDCALPETDQSGCDVDIIESGELRINGQFTINETLQTLQAEDRATLCRCGDSKNKPWCDGRHKKKQDFK